MKNLQFCCVFQLLSFGSKQILNAVCSILVSFIIELIIYKYIGVFFNVIELSENPQFCSVWSSSSVA